MKTAVLEELGEIAIKDVPEPAYSHREAVIKVKSCAVCGSDKRSVLQWVVTVCFFTIIGEKLSF